MDKTVDQRDDAGRGGKDLMPFGEGAVGSDDGALGLVAAADEFEHQVGMPVGVGEVADLVDHQQAGPGIVAEATAQGGVAVEGGGGGGQGAGGGGQAGGGGG